MVLAASHDERAYLDSQQECLDRDMDGQCWSYGEVAGWGWGIWVSYWHHDYSVNASEEEPLWHTFHAAPDEATARALATAVNLGQCSPDDGGEATPLPQ